MSHKPSQFIMGRGRQYNATERHRITPGVHIRPRGVLFSPSAVSAQYILEAGILDDGNWLMSEAMGIVGLG
jgi:hypothetical protein